MAKPINTGKELESIVADIYDFLSIKDENTAVELDVKLDSPDGPRQFDVVMTTKVADGETELITVIEVRDKARKLNLEAVDAFRSKMLDVGASKGIIVSKAGFQSGAVRKAKRQKIDLYKIQRLEDLKDFQIQTPAVVHLVKFGFIRIESQIAGPPPADAIDFARVYVDDVHFFEILRKEIAQGNIKPTILGSLSEGRIIDQSKIKVGSKVVNIDDELDGVNTWSPSSDSSVEYRKRFSAKPIPIENLVVKYQLYYEYYFGYLTDLPNTVALSNILKSTSRVFFNSNDLMDFKTLFNKFESLDDIPVREAMNYHLLESKDFASASKAFDQMMASK